MSSVKRTTRVLTVLGLAAGALAGCSSSPQTAYQLMQEQQQVQAQARQAEDEAARKAMPSQPEMFLSLIAQSMAQGRHFAALAYVDAYIQQYGNTPEIAPLRANALRMTGQEAASEAVYRKLVSSGNAAEGWHGLGLLAGARGDFAGAAEYLGKASRLKPTDADMLSDLGYARLRAGDISGARLPLGQAAELNPGSTKVIANLALLLLVEGESDRATRVMDQANMSEQARAQLLSLAQATRVSVVPAEAAASAAPAAPVASAAPFASAAPASRATSGDAVASATPVSRAPTENTASQAATPAQRDTVRFVDADTARQSTPSATRATPSGTGEAQTAAASATPPAPAVASVPVAAAPAAVQPAAAQTRPRVAATQPADLGMHSPSMTFLGNTPLVR